MVKSSEVDWNSPWASLPAVRGPVHGLADFEGETDQASHDTEEDSVMYTDMDVDGGEEASMESQPSGAQISDRPGQQLCLYCRTVTWDTINRHIRTRLGMTLKLSLEQMRRRAAQCTLCRILTGCVDEVNPDNAISPESKLFLTPLALKPKFRQTDVYALALNPIAPTTRPLKKGTWTKPGIQAGTISVYIDEEAARADPRGIGRSIAGRRVRAATDFGTLRQWMDKCTSQHRKCKDNTMYKTHSMTFANDIHPKKILPTRTIFIPDGEGCETVKLEEHGGERDDYVALSYCWGRDTEFLQLRHENREQLMQGIKVFDLPKTFRDAIEMTRQLGFRHLWIDALCIIQDDNLDWATESKLMGRLYAGSALTIAALYSATAHGGLFSDRMLDGEICALPYSSLSDSNDAMLYFQCIPSLQNQPRALEEEAHSKRAWTLQERLLAPRVIHCAQQQYYWECREMKCVEDGSLFPEGITQSSKYRPGSLIGALAVSHSSRQALDLWYEVIRTYSWRDITYQRDKLTAVDGLASTFGPRIKAEYIAGIWATDYAQALAWRRSRRCQALTPKQERAPSWSWAAYDGGINHLNQRAFSNHPKPAWRTLLSREKCNEVDHKLEMHLNGLLFTDPHALTVSALLGVEEANIFLDDGESGSKERSEKNLSCLALAEVIADPRQAHVLVLTQSEPDGAFHRIGIADVKKFQPLKAKMAFKRIVLR